VRLKGPTSYLYSTLAQLSKIEHVNNEWTASGPSVLIITSMPTLLLADDSELIRKTVKKLLETEPAIQIVGEATDFAEAIQMASDLKPDVLLLDLHMPDDRNLDPAYIRAHLLGSAIKIIGISLSGNDDDEARDLATSLGASTVLDKSRFYEELIPAILSC
jgi:two-component system, NarL family, response regulator NreC